MEYLRGAFKVNSVHVVREVKEPVSQATRACARQKSKRPKFVQEI